MFAIAFDLVVADTLEHHPRGVAGSRDVGCVQSGRCPHTDHLALVLGPGGCGGGLGWRFGVYPA